MRLDALSDKVAQAYDNLEYHMIFHSVHNFCVVDLSNFYLDVLKDRLYVESETSDTRRAAQTTIYMILSALTRMIAPIVSFTADEIWRAMPHIDSDNSNRVFLNDYPTKIDVDADDAFRDKWARIFKVRQDVQKALEIARANKDIGASLESKVTLYCTEELATFLGDIKDLDKLFIVSSVEITTDGKGSFTGEYDELSVGVEKASGEKCERCWTYSDSVGENSKHATLCDRCCGVLDK